MPNILHPTEMQDKNRYFLAKNIRTSVFIHKKILFKYINLFKERYRIHHVYWLPREDREVFSSRVSENLAPSSLGVSVHAWKRFPYIALGTMKNSLRYI